MREPVTLAALLLALFVPAVAESPDGSLGPVLDLATTINEAPGMPTGSIFEGFEENESVSLIGGNLFIEHRVSPALYTENEREFSLSLTYSSKNTFIRDAYEPCGPCDNQKASGLRSVFHGRSWVGTGWDLHLGRVFKRTHWVEEACPNPFVCTCTTPYYRKEWLFEDGTGAIHVLDDEDGGRIDLSPHLVVRKVDGQWVARYPNGDRHVYKQLVTSEYANPEPQHGGYIANWDRQGYYPTKLEDGYGNTVHVEYWEALNPRFPEAIRRIYFGESANPRWSISFRLHCYDDNGVAQPEGACSNEDLRGMLRQTASSGPNGDVLFTFDYDVDSITADYNGGTVPLLTQIRLPETVSQGQPAIRYDYGRSFGVNSSLRGVEYSTEYLFPLNRVDYPTGGTSLYEYGTWRAGNLAVCTETGGEGCTLGCADNEVRYFTPRYAGGVVERRLFPYGAGLPADLGRTHALFRWDRDFFYFPYDDPDGIYTEGETANVFRAIRPSGAIEEGWLLGDPKKTHTGKLGGKRWLGADGIAVAETTYQYDPNPATTNAGEPSFLQATTYTDLAMTSESDFTCSLGSTTTEKHKRVLAGWRLTSTSGDYQVIGDRRIEYRELEKYEDANSADENCRKDRNVVGVARSSFIEEAGLRHERQYRYDRPGDSTRCSGALSAICTKAGLPGDASTTAEFDVHVPHSCDFSNTGQSSDLVSFNDLNALGNLESQRFYGGDSYGGGPRSEYSQSYTWLNGRLASAQVSGLSYQEPTIYYDSSGSVASVSEPNGTVTHYSYDAMGRIEAIEIQGSPLRNLATYSVDLTASSPRWSTEVASGLGVSSGYDQTDPDQEYLQMVFDGLGRVVERKQALPGGRIATQYLRYDAQGGLVFESQWIEASDSRLTWCPGWESLGGEYRTEDIPCLSGENRPWGTVYFFGEVDTQGDENNPLHVVADGLGRLRRSVRVDGSSTEIDYCGPHREVRFVSEDELGVTELSGRVRYYYGNRSKNGVLDGAFEI